MIYFDNAATTTVDVEVIESFTKALKNNYGNASSKHRLGQDSEQLYIKAKRQIAKYLDPLRVQPEEILITSGATESNNLAIKGIANRYYKRGKHMITTKVEHPSVLEVFKNLQKQGFEVTYLNVNKDGIDETELLKALRKDTILVSIMGVNNEVGAVYAIEKLSEIVKKNSSAYFHTDATQALLKVKQDYNNCDLISFSAHKLHGIKGSGLLIKKSNVDIIPLFDGGGQEYGYRSGTSNLPSTIALATTLRIAASSYEERIQGARKIKEYLIEQLKNIESIEILDINNTSPFILNFITKRHKASVVAEALSQKDIMVSTKSACSSKNLGGSYVLKAYGYDEKDTTNGIRLSFCGKERIEDCDIFIKELKDILERIREE